MSDGDACRVPVHRHPEVRGHAPAMRDRRLTFCSPDADVMNIFRIEKV